VWNRSRRPSATVLGRRFRISKQTISRTSRGQRWAGHTVLAALLYATREQRSARREPRPRPGSGADPRRSHRSRSA
jgi:hypothetical protein